MKKLFGSSAQDAQMQRKEGSMKKAKPNGNPAAIDPLDRPVDLSKMKLVGVGIHFRQMAERHRYVQLDPDVYRNFPSAAEVNKALRIVKQLRQVGKHRK